MIEFKDPPESLTEDDWEMLSSDLETRLWSKYVDKIDRFRDYVLSNYSIAQMKGFVHILLFKGRRTSESEAMAWEIYGLQGMKGLDIADRNFRNRR